MRLHDQMSDAVSDVTADLTALSSGARAGGLALRRRRRVRATLGAAAAVTAIVGGGLALQSAGDDGPSNTPSVATEPTGTGAGLSGETAPISGRGAAAALMAAVDEVADGDVGSPGGSDLLDIDPRTLADNEVTAAFWFAPGGQEPGEVFANIQSYRAVYHETDRPKCEPGTDGCARVRSEPTARYDECLPPMVACEVTTLADGDVLRTYRDPVSTEDVVRTVAELVSPERDLRLVVSATGGVLDAEDLGTVVTQPWWDREVLPVEYVDAGARLADYDDQNASVDRASEGPQAG